MEGVRTSGGQSYQLLPERCDCVTGMGTETNAFGVSVVWRIRWMALPEVLLRGCFPKPAYAHWPGLKATSLVVCICRNNRRLGWMETKKQQLALGRLFSGRSDVHGREEGKIDFLIDIRVPHACWNMVHREAHLINLKARMQWHSNFPYC
jgi:hypothetical protein